MGVAFNFEEIVRIGVQIEKNGCEFYNLAAEKAESPKVKEALLKLASWEVEHISIFETLLKQNQCPSCVNDSWYDDDISDGFFRSVAESHIFISDSVGSLVEGCANDAEVFDMALRFEKDSVALYETLKSLVSPNCDDREKVQKVIDEELMHIALIQREIRKLQA